MSARFVSPMIFAAALLGPTAAPAQVDTELMKLIAPPHSSDGFRPSNHRYAVHLPSEFKLDDDADKDPDFVSMTGEARGFSAKLVIKRVAVPPGGSSSQLMLNTRDTVLAKLPNFAVLKTRKITIADRPCANLVGRYDYQGNKAYPQIVEQAYVIDGHDGFIIHFEVAASAYNDFQPRIADVFKTFRPLAPAHSAPESGADAGDKSTKARKPDAGDKSAKTQKNEAR